MQVTQRLSFKPMQSSDQNEQLSFPTCLVELWIKINTSVFVGTVSDLVDSVDLVILARSTNSKDRLVIIKLNLQRHSTNNLFIAKYPYPRVKEFT